MNGVFAVLYREFHIYTRRWAKHASSYAMSPFLFLLVFGWGLGRTVEVEGMHYLEFMVPGLATMAAMTQSYGMATEINIARFYWRVFEEFQTAPVAPWEIVLGEVLYGMVRGILAAAVVYGMGHLFGAPIPMSLTVFGLVSLHAFTFAAAAMVAAMVVRSHADQGHINTFFIVPMSFLCGTFFPLDRLPGWAEAVARLLPLTHSNLAIRASIVGQPVPMDSVWVMVGYAFLFYILAIRCVRRASA